MGSGATDTLQEALANAYLVNPDLAAARAKLRAIDEEVGVAKSGLRPTVTASADTGYANTHNDITGNNPDAEANFGPDGDIVSDGVTHPHGYALGLSQPLFEGFQNLNGVRQAKAQVQAGREDLREAEQTVLLAALTAYADVVRDQTIVRLRENYVAGLTKERSRTQSEFKAGEVTRTDTAQAAARLSGGIAFLNAARADLKTSRADYEKVIGHPPGKLARPPSIFRKLPASLEQAMTLSDGQNPAILSAVYEEEASLYQVNQIMGELLPRVTLEAQYQQRYELNKVLGGEERTTVVGRVAVPLYQGGGVSARVRQAKQTNTQFKRQVESARLSVHSVALANWGILQTSAAEIAAARAAVASNKVALEGTRKEQAVGHRTTLDVLNAQRELVDSEIGLVVSLRDRIVAEYSLAAAVGRLDAQSLGLSTPYYDPIEHYDDVKNKWAGLRPPPPPDADN
ncbi:MAG TPA: TolC family outer membrane protein [Methyloceanibacter sp.]|nr:TolC family outer membrane protein [Methyloceanibacter sp.]